MKKKRNRRSKTSMLEKMKKKTRKRETLKLSCNEID